MDVVAWLLAAGSTLFGYILPFLIVLSLVVFIHELGHFSVARWFGVKVETFSIGFGREIFGWTDTKGTRWKVGWLPLGGYVKFWGDENAVSMPDAEKLAALARHPDRAACFHYKPVWQRAAVVAAGPAANFLSAILVFAAIYATVGERVLRAQVEEVVTGGAAEAAGFQPGDVVLAVDGRAIDGFADLQRIVALSPGVTLAFEVERSGEQVMLQATPRLQETADAFGNPVRVGVLGLSRAAVSPEDVEVVHHNALSAVARGAEETWTIVTQSLTYLGGLIAGRQDPSQLSGPIGIAKLSGDVAAISLLALVHLAAVLSVSIGLINLFPIPMLDGGHLLYYGYEAVAGRPLGEQAQEFGFRVGLALVLGLMVVATWNDIVKLRLF